MMWYANLTSIYVVKTNLSNIELPMQVLYMNYKCVLGLVYL